MRGRIWNSDVLVADIEELETMDASEIYSERLNAKEIIFPKENGEFIFSNRGERCLCCIVAIGSK